MIVRRTLGLLGTLALVAGGALLPAARAAETARPPGAPASPVPHYEGLGKHRRKIRTDNPVAQRYFDQGLNFLFAFNHDEAIRSFQAAAEADPECAMAYWGIALANGPHINFPFVPEERANAAWEALSHARELASSAGDTDRQLIAALSQRYANPQPADRKPLDLAYANAMREVWKNNPKDADVGVLFAEAMMDLRPWDLWTPEGKAQPGTPEIVETLEQALAVSPDHPLGLHLYIHAVEASPTPGKAEKAADRLRNLTPGLGHLVHMPSHIDVLLGHWQKSVVSNERAIVADTRYVARSSKQGFYRLYMAHNRHMLAFGAMMQGDSKKAKLAIDGLLTEMPEAWKRENAPIADGYHAMPYELMMRFGWWNELLAAPEPPEYFPMARALRHAGRGVAFAALNRLKEARESQELFRKASAAIPADAGWGNNRIADLLAVPEALLEGEILFREGKRAEGLAALRVAAKKEDQLRYDEPPDWIQPVRHALGAALMVDSKPAEAESVYRADLKRWPENGWSLYGLATSLEAQNKPEAAEARNRFNRSWKRADVKLTASCFCQAAKH